MKTYLISITSDCQGVKENYLETLPKIKQSAIPIMVTFEPRPPQVKFKTIPVGKPYPGNLSRFCYFPKGFQDDDLIIFTDTADVIFQKEIPQLRDRIYVSSEQDTWGADNWWQDKLKEFNFHELDGLPIYCMGTWAMSYANVKELLEFIRQNKYRFANWEQSDQILFNWWLKEMIYEERTDLFGTLYANWQQEKIKKTSGNFLTKDGKLISIVHANGGPDLKKLLVQKNL